MKRVLIAVVLSASPFGGARAFAGAFLVSDPGADSDTSAERFSVA